MITNAISAASAGPRLAGKVQFASTATPQATVAHSHTQPAARPHFLRSLFEGYVTERLLESALKNFQPNEHGKRHIFRGIVKLFFAFILGRRSFADFMGRYATRSPKA